MRQRSLIETPYTGGPYDRLAVDLHADGMAQRIVVTLLADGVSRRRDPESWHHPQPSCDRLFCFAAGQADVTTSHGRLQLTAGRIHLLPEGHPFTITYGDDSLLYWSHIRILDATALPRLRRCRRILTLDAPPLADDLITAANRHDRAMQVSRVLECALRFVGELQPDSLTPDAERFAPLFAHLDHRLSPDLRIGELATVMGTTPAALSKAFRRGIGVPLKHYLQTRLMDQAKQALLFSDATIEEVAEELGYRDPFYFSRAFTRHSGTSPSSFRRLNREPES